MSIVSLEEVQAWLESTKLTLVGYDANFESIASDIALGRLAEVYDTSMWMDEATTPHLVRSVVSMLIAAWTYRRQYSEDTDSSPNYADWLEATAYSLLDKIQAGTVDLSEVAGFASSSDQPDFYPKDNNYDAVTGLKNDDYSFTMGMRW